MNELISVIVPVYNVQPYLRRCIDSLINQSYANIEIILIDDGSVDGSDLICDEYKEKDDRIKVHHQKYEGVSSARNKGLELADGNFIVFLDGDDEAHHDYVGRLYDTLKQNNVDISQCCLIRVRNGKRINELPVSDEVKLFSGLEMQWKIYDRNRYFTMCLCGKLFKKELFDGLSFPVGRINEDESLIYLLMYRAKKVGVIDDYLYYYHYNCDSITEKPFNINSLDKFYMLEEKYEFYRNLKLYDLADKTASEYFSQMSVIFCTKIKDKELKKQAFKKAKQFYIKDRKIILETAKLPKLKKIFLKLSYISVWFVKLYGVLMKKVLITKSKVKK